MVMSSMVLEVIEDVRKLDPILNHLRYIGKCGRFEISIYRAYHSANYVDLRDFLNIYQISKVDLIEILVNVNYEIKRSLKRMQSTEYTEKILEIIGEMDYEHGTKRLTETGA